VSYEKRTAIHTSNLELVAQALAQLDRLELLSQEGEHPTPAEVRRLLLDGFGRGGAQANGSADDLM